MARDDREVAEANASFAALADASSTDLADKVRTSLTGMSKHVGVPELAGLVTTAKVGRVRTCRIGPCRLEKEMEWIARCSGCGTPASRRWTMFSANSNGKRRAVLAGKENESQRTTVQKTSDRQVVVTRTFDVPARLVFEAWTIP